MKVDGQGCALMQVGASVGEKIEKDTVLSQVVQINSKRRKRDDSNGTLNVITLQGSGPSGATRINSGYWPHTDRCEYFPAPLPPIRPLKKR